MTTRRRFLEGAALATLGPFIEPARAMEPMIFTTPFGFDPTFIDVMNAKSGGYFAREGIDATLVGPPGNAEAFQLVIAGKAQFSYIPSVDFIRAVATRGAPFYAVACLSQRIGFQIVSLKEKPVRTGADLKGRTIGVLSVGGLSELLIQVVMAQAGLVEGEARIEVAGNNPGEVDLLRKGRLDAFICNHPIVVTLKRVGAEVEYFDIDKVLPSPGGLYFCTRDTAENRPELVLGVLRALKASVVEILTQPLAPIFRRAAKDFDIPRMHDMASLVAVQQAVNTEDWLAEGRQNLFRNVPSLWQSACDELRLVGIADVKDPTSLYTNDFVDRLGKI